MFGRVFVFRDMIALYQVLADAGMRLSEVASLVWDDVELWTDGLGLLTVHWSKTNTKPWIVYLTLQWSNSPSTWSAVQVLARGQIQRRGRCTPQGMNCTRKCAKFSPR